MSLLINRIVITLILTVFFSWSIFLVWTKNVDLLSWGKNKAENLLPITSNQREQINFSVSVDCYIGPVDFREYIDEEPKSWSRVRLGYRLAILTTTTQWSSNTIVGVVFYSADRLYSTESDIPQWISDAVQRSEKPVHHRLLHHSTSIGQINSAKRTATKWMEAYISINHSPWNAAVYVLPENSPAQWFQFTIKRGEPKLEPKSGQGVQSHGDKLKPVKRPMVSAGYEKLL